MIMEEARNTSVGLGAAERGKLAPKIAQTGMENKGWRGGNRSGGEARGIGEEEIWRQSTYGPESGSRVFVKMRHTNGK